MLEVMCRERGGSFHVVPFEYAMDNGAMIAWNGILMHRSGDLLDPGKSTVRPKWRTDQVVPAWVVK
jgi:tRNA A37 threonylcarbamoyltransferase TsaD